MFSFFFLLHNILIFINNFSPGFSIALMFDTCKLHYDLLY